MNNSKNSLPNGWTLKKLGEIFDITSGTTPSRIIEEYFENGTHLWVKTTDLNNQYITDTEEKVTDLAMKKTSLKKLPIGTVLVAMYGGFNQIGRTGLLKREASVNQALSAILPNYEVVEPYFLLNWLNCKIETWKNFAASSRKDPNITKSDVVSFPIILPPLPEQQKIAQILGTWDEAIQTTATLLAQLEKRKKGLMQQLLSPKTDWKEVRLGECFERVRRTVKNVEDIPILTISAKSGFLNQNEKFNKIIAGNSLENYVMLYEGEFSYNKGNSKTFKYGCIYKMKERNGLVPNVYISFRAIKEINTDFFQHYFLNGVLDSQLKSIITSGARADGLLNVSSSEFFKMKIIIPPLLIQQKIAAILNAADAELRETEAYLEKLKTQKRGLMQQLLTGKVRVITT